MYEPNQTLIDNKEPTITLAGKEWPIPALGVRQNRVVVPGLLKFWRSFPGGSGRDIADRLETEHYDLVSDIVYAALTRGHKTLTRAEFDELPISIEELFGAIPTIGRASGLLREKQPGEPATGETQAESHQTGTN